MHTKPGVAGNYVGVVFLDFHVEGMMVSELDAVLERSRRTRAAVGMPLASMRARPSAVDGSHFVTVTEVERYGPGLHQSTAAGGVSPPSGRPMDHTAGL